MNRNIIMALLVCLAFFANCSTAKKTVSTSLKNIDTMFIGEFMDDYKIRYTLTNKSLVQHPGVKYNLISYNEKEQYFIAQNDLTNVNDAGLYTRIDIMRFSNMEPWRWGFCLSAYKAATKEEAEKTAAADRANPKKGCGGYPFSRMKRVK